MRTSSQRVNAKPFRYPSAATNDSDALFGSVLSGERIGGPFRERRRISLPWGGIIVVVTSGLCLILFEAGVGRQDRLLELPEEAPVSQVQLPPGPEERRAAVPEPPANAQVGLREPSAAHSPDEQEPSPPRAPSAIEIQPDEPLPPPTVDKNDRYQVRALAAGLHPGLSRALLVRLSASDFRNAAYAIRTALAKTPDGQVFVWPGGRRSDRVRFQVRFVPGPFRNCRRYVVEVIMNGWVTTARPMEKCMSKPVAKTAKSRQKTSPR